MSTPFRVFLCAPDDGAETSAVAADLARGAAEVGPVPGETWADQLEAVRQCDLFVVAITRSSLRSARCRMLQSYASALNRPLLPVLLDDLPIELLPPELAQTQAVDYRERSVGAGIALAVALTRREAPPPLPEPLPAPPPEPTLDDPTDGLPELRSVPHATRLLVLSVLGLLTSPLPVISLPVWIIARKRLREIDQSGHQYDNRDVVLYARRIGLIGILLPLVSVLVIVVAFIAIDLYYS